MQRVINTGNGTTARVRKLSTKSQLLALPYGQLAGAESLRDIGALHSHAQGSIICAQPRCRARLCRMPIICVARTCLPGFLRGYSDCPLYAALRGPNVNDITAAKDMPIGPMAAYVFDLGYYDYGWWAKLDAKGCHIVTSLKANTKLSNIIENAVREGSGFLGDRIGLLPRRLATSRKSPFADPVREARVRIETGKVLRILSKDLDPPAEAAVGSWSGRRGQLLQRASLGTVVGQVRSQPRISFNPTSHRQAR